MKLKKVVEKQSNNMGPAIEPCEPNCLDVAYDVKVFFVPRKTFNQNYTSRQQYFLPACICLVCKTKHI